VSNRSLRPVSTREEKTVMPVRTHDVLLGRYKLLEKIGEGGMGTVYVAHDQELDRQVAVKLLASNLVNDDEVVERFEREARLTAKLDHPNIVPIYDVGRHEGRPFIVMKVLVGDTLAGLLRSKGGLTSDETQKLLKQVAAGLDYIHRQGFIHRDIKAGNIFVAPDGLATILDFGILRPKSAAQGLTRTGMVMGTPHYMAPEQAMGLKDVDHRVDIYALAVVLFECLTGTLPFEADSELRLIQMQAHSPPPDIIDRAPWIPRPVADVVRRALAKRPEERFDSGADLVKALEEAYRTSGGHQAAPLAKTHPTLSTSTAPSLRKLAAGETNPAAAPPAEARPITALSNEDLQRVVVASRRQTLFIVFAAAAVLLGLFVGWRVFTPAPVLPVAVAELDAGLAGLAAAVVDTALDAGASLVAVADAGEEDEEDAGVGAIAVATPDAGRPVVATRKFGKLNIITTHSGDPYWAQVTVDGLPRGRTPLQLDLPVGLHQVKVERAGFRVQSREIRVASGKSVAVRIDLEP
jgi:serine/threonine protein kinase